MNRFFVVLMTFVVQATRLAGRSRGDLILEVLPLRQQVTALQRERPRPNGRAPAVRVRAGQVVALIDGRPLSAERLMPPGRREGDGAVIPTAVFEQVLERSIQRELILQEAEAKGVALDERRSAQLEATQRHLTSNPLSLRGGWTLKDLNALGDERDAAFHVRDKAARLLQIQLLELEGKPDTAETRGALRDRLRKAADVEVVDTRGPGAEGP